MAMKVRALLISCVVLTMVWLVGCDHYVCGTTFGNASCTATGSGLSQSGGTSNAAFVFAVDTGGTVDGYSLIVGESGSFAATSGYTAPTIPKNDGGVGMVEAQSKYLYAAFASTNEIYGWSIGSAGGLTAISGMPITASFVSGMDGGVGLTTMVTNPAGTLLFFADTADDLIYAYQIGSSGALTAVSGSPFSAGISPGNLAVDGLGKYLYATELTGDHVGSAIGAYAINSTSGALTTIAGSPFSFPMWQVQGEPTGRYLIGTTGNSESVTGSDNDTLYVFSIAQSGTVGALTQTATVTTQFSPFSITTQPSANGDLVYSFGINDTDTGFNGIEGFQINDSTGALTEISGSPFTGVTLGSSGQFDPGGAYLFDYGVVENTDGSVTVQMGALQLGTGGALTQPEGQLTLVTPGVWAVSDVP